MSDSQMQRGANWLRSLLELAGVPSAVQAEQGEDSYLLTIDASGLSREEIDILIGPKGAAIDAIQYLANTIANIGLNSEEQASYTIELDGYRARRWEQLQAIASAAAEQARQTGLEIEIKDLSSAERRQVHTFFKEYTDLETYSRGQEPDRRLVIRRL
ncbi:R3H domain-containing nucleic acid-binding protein [[Phormidium] sp. ETS-05]|uniref:Jag family protein n=1 Tax=[Phormidium] sp. ETS-05 TaxID=222819 RepID=UPI0018EF29DE|nr:R3H domain-containing nucleic acid-binding protein [[Phormidium] sp. ETS-05]